MQAVATILAGLLSLYSFAIVMRIVLSWGNIGELKFGNAYRIVKSITDPYLNLFRSLPGLQKGNLDFSPLVAMVVLGIANNVLSIYGAEGVITLGVFLALITSAVWSVLSFFLMLFILLAGARVALEYRPSPNSIQYIAILDNLLRGPMDKIHTLIFSGKEMEVKTLLITTTGSFIVLRMLMKALFTWLTQMLANLPF